jgi:hypothetical protein
VLLAVAQLLRVAHGLNSPVRGGVLMNGGLRKARVSSDSVLSITYDGYF